MKMGICCMCDQFSEHLVSRKDEDYFCMECHEKYCEHLDFETVPVGGGETIVVCHDCGDEL